MTFNFAQQKEFSEDRSSASNASIATGAFGANLTNHNLMVAHVYYNTLGGQRGVALSGAGSPTWNAETVLFDGSANYLHSFYAYDIPGGTTAQLQAAFTNIGNGDDVFYPAIYTAEFSGLKHAAARLAFAANYQGAPTTATDAVTSGLLGTLAAQPAAIIGFAVDMAGHASLSPAAGSLFTSRTGAWNYQGTLAASARPEDRRVTATTSVAALFTAIQNSGYMAVAWAFEEASGGGSNTAAISYYMNMLRANQ